MIPFVILVMLLGRPSDHPYSDVGYHVNGSGRGISGKMVDMSKTEAVSHWSPYDFSGSRSAPHAFAIGGGHAHGGSVGVSH